MKDCGRTADWVETCPRSIVTTTSHVSETAGFARIFRGVETPIVLSLIERIDAGRPQNVTFAVAMLDPKLLPRIVTVSFPFGDPDVGDRLERVIFLFGSIA